MTMKNIKCLSRVSDENLSNVTGGKINFESMKLSPEFRGEMSKSGRTIWTKLTETIGSSLGNALGLIPAAIVGALVSERLKDALSAKKGPKAEDRIADALSQMAQNQQPRLNNS